VINPGAAGGESPLLVFALGSGAVVLVPVGAGVAPSDCWTGAEVVGVAVEPSPVPPAALAPVMSVALDVSLGCADWLDPDDDESPAVVTVVEGGAAGVSTGWSEPTTTACDWSVDDVGELGVATAS
jgi:hypothetical protein